MPVRETYRARGLRQVLNAVAPQAERVAVCLICSVPAGRQVTTPLPRQRRPPDDTVPAEARTSAGSG